MDRPSSTTRTVPPGLTFPETTPLVIPSTGPARGRARADLPLRREGPAKLTGEAKYADDLVFPGAWFGATIRSTEPHARFVGVELDDAFDWSRVVVVTAEDIPGENVVSLIDSDQPVLVPVGGEIRHQAEPCLLLAAPDRGTLHAAKRHVRLRTERLAPVFDPLESDREFAHYTVESGDAAAAMEGADLVIEGIYRVGHQEQLYIENQAMIAVPREDGGVTVHGSLQCPYYVHKAMKRALAHGRRARGGGAGGDRRRLRRQGGVPERPRPPRLAAGAQVPQAGAHDLRPPRGHQRHDQAAPGRGPLPLRRLRGRRARGAGDRGDHGRRRVLPR